MCRLAAHIGAARTLASLLYEPPHSLQHQAYAPRELLHGNVNVDGTGLAWWPPGEEDRPPLRYVGPLPPWSDPNLPVLAPRLWAVCQLAAVRGATPGVPYGTGGVAPFVIDGLALAHNGWLGGFRSRGVRQLLERDLPDDAQAELTAVNDSLLLAWHVAVRHRDEADLVAAVQGALAAAEAACRKVGEPATLNLVATDGQRIVAARRSLDLPTNSLYVRTEPDGHLLASEPLDGDDGWEPVPADHLAVVTAARSQLVAWT